MSRNGKRNEENESHIDALIHKMDKYGECEKVLNAVEFREEFSKII